MILSRIFTRMFCLNLARRQDRRVEYEQEFERAGLTVERFPAVDAKWVTNLRGFQTPGKYAHTLGLRMVLRKARAEGVPAVFFFEDDVKFSPSLNEELERLMLPEDWGMFYLGGMHFERPEVVATGLVRATGMMSTHAFGVREAFYSKIIEALNKRGPNDDAVPGADVVLARLHREIPTYAPFPNLVWQREGHSDLAGGTYQPFTADGQQVWLEETLAGVGAEALGGKAYEPAKEHASRLRAWFRYGALPVNFNHKLERDNPDSSDALSSRERVTATCDRDIAFLLEGPGNSSAVWRRYLEGFEARVRILSIRTGEKAQSNRARRRLSLLQEALEDKDSFFFFFLPSSCLPIRPLPDLLGLIDIGGKSRFAWAKPCPSQPEKSCTSRIPGNLVRRHLPWILLNREAAELVAQDDFSEYFLETSSDEQWCYEATTLKLKGYPLEKEVARGDLVLSHCYPGDEDNPAELAASLFASGRFFAVNGSETLAKFGLHFRTESVSDTTSRG